MAMFQRLSIGPTIPQRIDAELWRLGADTGRFMCRLARVRLWLWMASVVLGGATMLLRLGLIRPEVACDAFETAERLTRNGLRDRLCRQGC